MNSLDFVIFVFAFLFLINPKRLSSTYLIIASFFGFAGFTAAVVLSPILLGNIKSELQKGIFTLLMIVVMTMVFYIASSFVANSFRIKLITSRAYTIDKILAIPTKVSLIILAIFSISQVLIYIPVLSLQFISQGSSTLYIANRILPISPLSQRMAQLAPNQFNNLALAYDQYPPTLNQINDAGEFQSVVDRSASSVVKISGRSCIGLGVGSGFIAAPNLIITNAHVVVGASTIFISNQEGSYPATPIIIDKDRDIAVLYSKFITGTPVNLSPDTVANDIPAMAMGYPGGHDLTFAQGKTLSMPPSVEFSNLKLKNGEAIYLDVLTQPGNSGGPIFDLNGDVIAVVSGGGSNRTVGIGSKLTKELLKEAKGKLIPTKTGVCDISIKRL